MEFPIKRMVLSIEELLYKLLRQNCFFKLVLLVLLIFLLMLMILSLLI